MTCPRCEGFTFSERLGLQVWAVRCLNYGHRFGEAILDLHHGFSIPPPPQTRHAAGTIRRIGSW